MQLSLDLAVIFLVTVAFIVFMGIEVAGLTLPGWHTISYLAHNYPPLRWGLLVSVALFGFWLFLHTGRPIPK